MAEISSQEARAIVDDIREKNGGITDEDRQRTPESVLRSIGHLQSTLGASIRTVAREIYSSNTRFVFELIQNAEDNKYTRALALQETPFLKFALHHDRIIIDSNEDGFQEANVRAICNVGKSTKTSTGGYIGEKGIGFKSVFKVAYKVHIQSGPFSFFLEHRDGNNGMGMITSINQEHRSLPKNVRTRMTLFLADPTGFNDRAREFAEIPDTLILFLSKLRQISVEIIPREGLSSITSYEHDKNQLNNLQTLHKTSNNETEETSYYVEKSTLSNLPKDLARSGRTEAEIILAFPIASDYTPVIEPQYVYSFLPLSQEGFNFLIQSDFITQASREGIRYCEWNDAILDGVCDVFVQAVRHFCTLPALQYEWLAYVPGSYIIDPFWGRLRGMIIKRLRNFPILLTRKGSLDIPENLHRLSARHCDRHGQPLLEDLDHEVYLSPSYSWSNYSHDLEALGITDVSYRKLLDRLDPYLRGPQPRFLESTFDSDWHTRVANLLITGLTKFSRVNGIGGRIKRMPLVPLFDGSLSETWGSNIYFPDDTEGNSIPEDLGLHLVSQDAIRNETRKTLFSMLNVTNCEPTFVIDQILKRYNRPRDVTLVESVSHLRYLYRTFREDEELNARIYVIDHQETPVFRKYVTFGEEIIVDDLYFETPGQYGTKQLAQELESLANERHASGIKIHFIHEFYLSAVPDDARSHGRSWGQWLEEVASVRRIPKLKNSTKSNDLSTLFKNIIDVRPDLLICLLKSYWESYESELTPQIIDKIRDAEVPCRVIDELYPLKSTYFPSGELREICSQARINDAFDYFVLIPSSWATETIAGWEFLTKFGVGTEPDLQFFKDLFEVMDEKLPLSEKRDGYFAIYELFVRLRGMDTNELENLFKSDNIVCIPGDGSQTTKMTVLSRCVWKGLSCLRTKHPLAIYREYSQNKNVQYLFKEVLKVPDANESTYIEELKRLKRSSNVIFENLCAVYKELSKTAGNETTWGSLRNQFEQESLIYIPAEESWHPPTSCVWESAPKIGRQFGISSSYSSLQNFFVDRLSVQTPNVGTYVEQLTILAEEQPPNIEKIKTAIENINYFNPEHTDLDSIRGLDFLPVKSTTGETELSNIVNTFYIVDRKEYGDAFEGKVPILDFSLEDIRRLRCFLEALGLVDKYMSSAVVETTTVQQPASEPSVSLTREFRGKSKAFCRCAIHHGSHLIQTKIAEVYRKLQCSTVYESDGFQKNLSVSQGGLIVNAESTHGLFHVVEDRGIPQLFVPRDSKKRQICYRGQLPKALVHHLSISDLAAIESFRQVTTTPVDILDEVLDEHGIVQFPDIDSVDPESHSYEDIGTDELHVGESTAATSSFQGEQINSSHSDSDAGFSFLEVGEILEASQSRYERRRSAVSDGYHRLAAVPTFEIPPEDIRLATDNTLYIQLLSKVIDVARRAVFPAANRGNHGESVNGPSFADNPSLDEPFSLQSASRLQRDIKIGAAGELYIFEILRRLALPNFERPNWRSNIRKEVRIHPDYRDLDPWSGPETADIVYQDRNSAFTRRLITLGYLPEYQWGAANPEYFVEVKSTTGPCETQFYMSKSQYRRMQLLRLQNMPAADVRVYMILRVFNLGKDNMDFRIYMDPESLRVQGLLQFTPETYSVKPA